LAICLRFLGLSRRALAFPPFLPKATAAGSFPSSSGRGTSSLIWPVPHDVDGVADHVAVAALAFGASGHY